ncbi:MAG: ABC transporter permease [Rhizobiales bacterium]|jgi:spermidine/putrescine transport system permease protein|nr:ABC transporter permease [Hyphomicrobiales bacterium]MDQ3557793.1 ABC transporter permease [Pseudomonadota bacterium]
MPSPQRVDPLRIFACCYIAFLYAPIVLIVLFSLNDSLYVAFPLKQFTLRWYAAMAGNPALLAALRNSVELGLGVSLISTAMGMLSAKAVTGVGFPGRRAMLGLLVVPLIIPTLILGIALLFLIRRLLGWDLSLWTIGAGHILLCLPFTTLIFVSRLEGFDRSLEEASLDLGRTRWQTFWRITFPLSLPAVVSSLLLAFTVSFDEFVLAFFLGGNDTTLPLFIWSQLRFPAKLPTVLALGSCILLASSALVALSEWLRRRGRATDGAGAIPL